jgi:AcrR family transcriptional regulator
MTTPAFLSVETATMSPPASMDDHGATAALELATDELFYNQGVAAVTVAAVRDASGVSLRRIYNLCPSKADLISLWLRHRHRTWTAGFVARVNANVESGNEPVHAVFGALEAWMVETEFRGCGFINTHAETSELTDGHLAIIQHHKRAIGRYLETVTGHGDAMAVLIDGAIVHAALFRSTDPIHHAERAATALTRQDRHP